jgi:hypothetical protein
VLQNIPEIEGRASQDNAYIPAMYKVIPGNMQMAGTDSRRSPVAAEYNTYIITMTSYP